MTARLGDARAVEMVRAHDAVLKRAVRDTKGRIVKHTGDGMMVSFTSPKEAVHCAQAIQHGLRSFNQNSTEKMAVRIGIHVGEPIEDSADLFGATVQTAARLCQKAPAGAIVISDSLRAHISDDFEQMYLGSWTLRGITTPIDAYQISWE